MERVTLDCDSTYIFSRSSAIKASTEDHRRAEAQCPQPGDH
jgi:hypothetical protein